MKSAYWFRRDRRIGDNKALFQASLEGELLTMFCYHRPTFENLSGNSQHSLRASLEALDSKLGHNLNVCEGYESMVSLLEASGVGIVYATEAFDTQGRLEQAEVAKQLDGAGIALKLQDSNYLVRPGSVTKPDGTAYRVYTPFFKAWQMQDFENPIDIADVRSTTARVRDFPDPTKPASIKIHAGEDAALKTLQRFLTKINSYHLDRDKTWLSGTSKLSHALAHGEIHPRTIVQRLGGGEGAEVFLKEIAWREFYADVLYRHPHTYDKYYDQKFERMRYDDPVARSSDLAAWREGKTGYPIVDAAMRQLSLTGWMHNRARMIVASFLIKDLHLEWQLGANWFEQNLTDFDPASNSHGWQWTAGCGTDASPYFRVFNPTLQGQKFDPDGLYIKKYIPELAHLDKSSVHQPWLSVDGLAKGYPAPILDHAAERDETLLRYKELKSQ